MARPADADFSLAADPRLRRLVLAEAYKMALSKPNDDVLANQVLITRDTSPLIERLAFATVVGGLTSTKQTEIEAAHTEWEQAEVVRDSELTDYLMEQSKKRAEFIAAGGKTEEAPTVNVLDAPRRPRTDAVGTVLEQLADGSDVNSVLNTIWDRFAAAEAAEQQRQLTLAEASGLEGGKT